MWARLANALATRLMHTLTGDDVLPYWADLTLTPGEVNPIRYTVEVAVDPEAFVPRFREIATSIDREATADSRPIASTMRIALRRRSAVFLLLVGLAGRGVPCLGYGALRAAVVHRVPADARDRDPDGPRRPATDIVSDVARRAALQAGIGLGLGVAWGWVLLDTTEFGINTEVVNIPLTLALTAAAAACVCALACAYPTLRGLRPQPTEALRES